MRNNEMMHKKQSQILCHVAQPDSVVYEIEVDSKADASECLSKICEKLGIIEVDYFGLKYYDNKRHEAVWVNLRNQLTDELPGPPPYRLRLCVKFFTQPENILQEPTRHQFYVNIKEQLKQGQLHGLSDDDMARAAGLMAQVELGDLSLCGMVDRTQYVRYLPAAVSPDVRRQAANVHRSLAGLSTHEARRQLLQLVAGLPTYGMEFHSARPAGPQLLGADVAGETVRVGVGPETLMVMSDDWQQVLERISFPALVSVIMDGKRVTLSYLKDDGTEDSMEFRFGREMQATALYRCVTEMHTFYCCDTVQGAVASQFSRDLKGTLASLFNDKTSLGKRYVFDVQRTFHEAYDRARRLMYREELVANNETERSEETDLDEPANETDDALASEASAATEHIKDAVTSEENRTSNSQAVSVCSKACVHPSGKGTKRSRVHSGDQRAQSPNSVEDLFLCRVCMDQTIDSVLCPCGHVVCCMACAAQLTACPVCRLEAPVAQKLFLPIGINRTTSVVK